MGDIRGGGAPPPEADEIRVATLDEVANEGNWKLHRGGEGRSFRGFDLCESIRVWMQAVAGGKFSKSVCWITSLPCFDATHSTIDCTLLLTWFPVNTQLAQ